MREAFIFLGIRRLLWECLRKIYIRENHSISNIIVILLVIFFNSEIFVPSALAFRSSCWSLWFYSHVLIYISRLSPLLSENFISLALKYTLTNNIYIGIVFQILIILCSFLFIILVNLVISNILWTANMILLWNYFLLKRNRVWLAWHSCILRLIHCVFRS